MPAFHNSSRRDASPIFSKNPVLERTQSQWLFTPQELLLSPSILEGMPVAQEMANRQKGVNFITQVGIMLKLPQLTLATASVYLHRFFMRHAMVQNNKPGLHHYSVAATAIFLATKVEENYRKMRELVVACCRVAQKQPNLVVDEQSKEYWKWRDTILHNEDLLLEALCFDLQLEQPYRILLDFLRHYAVQENKQLRNTSWAFLNDSLVTTMCLQLTPCAIAGSALYMGVKFAGITLPDDDRGRPWWEQLDLDIQEIQRGCTLMAEVYENPALPRQGQKDAYTKDDDLAMFERTRHTSSPQPDRSPAGSVKSDSQGVKRDRDMTEDQNSETWGSSMAPQPHSEDPLAPSPKKPRRTSQDDGAGLSERPRPRVPPPPATDDRSFGDSTEQVDNVQKRIDEIVQNSASGRVPRPNLSRGPSNQQSSQSDSSRRVSSTGSAASWNGQPSSYSNGNSHPDRMPPPRRSESQENSIEPDQARPSSQVPPPPPNERPSQAPPPGQTRNGVGANEIDDAEKVDYGSEEGEL